MRTLALALLAFALPALASAQPVSDCPAEESAIATAGAAVSGAFDASGLTYAPDGYVRNTGAAEAPPASLTEAAARAKKLPVPFRVQEGPTCGLYALGMVMDYYHSLDRSNEVPFVQPGDETRADSHNYSASTGRQLFGTAKRAGYFEESLRIVGKEGGMFVADQLGQLATKFGYRYDLIENATATDIRAVVDRGHPALVGFDVDYDGNPANTAGKRAHWGVVTGYFTFEGVDYFTAQHGWEARQYIWRADALESSMRQIQPTLGPKIVEVFPRTH